MKPLVLLGSLLSLSLSVSAQRMSFRGGPEMGLNIYNMTARYEDGFGDTHHESGDFVAGIKIGGILDLGFTRHFSIQPGLFFSQKGYKDNINAFDYSYHVNYLELPINFLFKAGTRRTGHFFIGGGPYLAFGVGGKYKDDSGINDDINFGDNDSDDLRGFDVGMNFTAGYEMPFGLLFRGNVGVGLANIMPNGDSDNSLHNWGLGMSVGYLFGH